MNRLAPTLREISATLALPVTPAQEDQLARFLALLQQWNATYNLSAVREPEAMLVLHLADCLAAVPPLLRRAVELDLPPTLLDVGSGGGLPGVVLAIMLPGWQVSTIDAVAKKVAFVRQAAGSLGLQNLRAEHGRVEQSRGAGFGVITSRAFSSLAQLVELSRHRLAERGLWMAMKGKHPGDELADLPQDIEAFHVEPLSVPGLEAERCLVWMRPRRDTPAA